VGVDGLTQRTSVGESYHLRLGGGARRVPAHLRHQRMLQRRTARHRALRVGQYPKLLPEECQRIHLLELATVLGPGGGRLPRARCQRRLHRAREHLSGYIRRVSGPNPDQGGPWKPFSHRSRHLGTVFNERARWGSDDGKPLVC
jgi:hypothetical protein